MPATPRAKSSAAKVRAHRARMRAKGMRLVQIWVPDPSAPGFAAEARRQSRRVAKSPRAAEDQAFVDAISWFNNEPDDRV
jgi:hypothetical protein